MTKEQLYKIIAQGEGQQLEFKKSVAELDRVIYTLTAFANTNPDGGRVLIGVGDKGKVKEVVIGHETIKQIADKVSAHTDPVLYPKIEAVKETQDKGIIVITIDGSPNKPHLSFGRAYKRVGSTTTQMTRAEYERLLFKRKSFSFDSQIVEEATLEDVDEEKMRWFLREAKKQRGLNIKEDMPVDEALMRLKLSENGQLTNAAVLLFGKAPQDYFIQSEVKCIRFKGTGVTGSMIDLKVIEGNIIDQVISTENFIFNHIPMAAWIESGEIQRQEKWLYPPKAIREAVVNAIAHRNYQSVGKIQVRIFDDRIEFWNPGELPPGLTFHDLKQKHKSIPQNPLIAKQFFWIRYIEEVGTGTNKMVDWCIEWRLPEPDFEQITGDFVVTFRKSKLTEEYLDSLGLNERQKRAVEYVKTQENITNREYQELNNISKRTASYELKELVEKGLLKRTGKAKRDIKYIIGQ